MMLSIEFATPVKIFPDAQSPVKSIPCIGFNKISHASSCDSKSPLNISSEHFLEVGKTIKGSFGTLVISFLKFLIIFNKIFLSFSKTPVIVDEQETCFLSFNNFMLNVRSFTIPVCLTFAPLTLMN